MTQDTLIDTLTTLADPLAASLGLRLWGIELAFSGRSLLRVYIESAETGQNGTPQEQEAPDGAPVVAQGVSIEQCAELSRLLGLTLDVEDIIPGAYVLEVSSPGLDRTFFSPEQLSGAVGKVVDITLKQPAAAFHNRRKFRGTLEYAPAASANFALRVSDAARPGEEEPQLLFIWDDVKKAKQVHVVPEKILPGKGPSKGTGKNTKHDA